MTVIDERPAVPTPGSVTLPIWGGGTMTIPEPSWCDHKHERDAHPTDVSHDSPEVSVHLPVQGGAVFELLAARITQSPFGGPERMAPVALIDVIDGEFMEALDPEGLDRVIGQFQHYANELILMRERLVEARAEWQRTRAGV